MSKQLTNSGNVGQLVGTQSKENLAEGNPQYKVLVVGNCPACKIGYLESEYSKSALVVGFLFGIYAARILRKRICSHCGAVFDYKKQPIKKDNDPVEKTDKK